MNQESINDVDGKVVKFFKPDLAGKINYDSSSSKNGYVPIVASKYEIPTLALGRYIKVSDAEKIFLLQVSEGAFSEPLIGKSDDPINVKAMLSQAVHDPGSMGRCEAKIIGEIINGKIEETYLRPSPTTTPQTVSDEELTELLGFDGDVEIGYLKGPQAIKASVYANEEGVFDFHLGVFGGSGYGKTSTVTSLVQQAQVAKQASVVFDVEGQFTALEDPCDDPNMIDIFNSLGMEPKGLNDPIVYVPFNMSPRNKTSNIRCFSLDFSDVPPAAFSSALGLTEYQRTVFEETAYKFTDFVISRIDGRDAFKGDVDENGYPYMILHDLKEIVGFIAHCQGPVKSSDFNFESEKLQNRFEDIKMWYNQMDIQQEVRTWRTIRREVNKLAHLNVYDVRDAEVTQINYHELVAPGKLSIFDFSGSASLALTNTIIAVILRRIQNIQSFRLHRGLYLSHVSVVIDEAQKFLNSDNDDAGSLVYQVKNIVQMGRKRRVGLVLATHVPEQINKGIVKLIQNHIVHRLPEAGSEFMKKFISDASNFDLSRLSKLKPGEALCSFNTQWQQAGIFKIIPSTAKLIKAKRWTNNAR